MKFSYNRVKAKSDEALMSLIASNNRFAFEELYNRYSKKMLIYFYRMLYRDYEKAKDFMQDLFLKIIEKSKSFDSQKIFSTWIYTLASNMCKNEYKKMEIRIEHLKNESIKTRVTESSFNEIDLKSFAKALYNSIEKMDYEHKTTFLLRYGNELSIKEIAEIFKCPEGTVKSRLFYTIKYLSEKLTIYDPKVS